MHDRDEHEHFVRTMESLKTYKDHINRDVMSLIDRSSPLNLRAEELMADKISSNSHASKQKRNEEFMRGMHLYDIEQSEILLLLNEYKMKQRKQFELDEENDSRFREEKERIKKYERETKPVESDPIVKKSSELLKKLLSEIESYLLKIEKYILQLNEFITSLQQNIEKQRATFLAQFNMNIINILSGMGVRNGNHLEINAGSKKIEINIESTANKITDMMQEKFDKGEEFDSQKFKADIKEAFVREVVESNNIDRSDVESVKAIENVTEKFSDKVVEQEGVSCEKEIYIDQIQMQRLKYSKAIFALLEQEKEKLMQCKEVALNQSPGKTSLKQLEQNMEFVSEIKNQVAGLVQSFDFVKEARTNNALEAARNSDLETFRNRKRMKTQAVENAPAPNQEPANSGFKPG